MRLHYSTLHYSKVQYITLHTCTRLGAQNCMSPQGHKSYVIRTYILTLQYSTIHYVTLQYITLQYNILQHITLHTCKGLGAQNRMSPEGHKSEVIRTYIHILHYSTIHDSMLKKYAYKYIYIKFKQKE